MRKFVFFLFYFTCHIVNAQTILPTPTTTVMGKGFFQLSEKIEFFSSGSEKIDKIFLTTLFELLNVEGKKQSNPQEADVFFLLTDKENIPGEGYSLSIYNDQIRVEASTEAGLFYGMQSLVQLIFEGKQSETNQDIRIPCMQINDYPKHTWRSFMLDSGRQYQSVAFIKRYIDYLAMLKMNVFHWHLTEGIGWRVQIKKYPRLTSVGAFVGEGPEQKGFYSQDEIREVVAYARERHITVVPEIDLPGHSEAALTAYPEMTCLKKAPESVMAFSSHIFCGGSEKTYQFVFDILDEVCELFPSEYIHLGGDEAPKNDWDQCTVCQGKIKEENLKNSHDLQLYFSKRLADYLKEKGRKVIFWGDVVYEDGVKLPDNVVIYWWNFRGHGDLALKQALKNGYPVICGTNYYTYLNFPVTPWSNYRQERTFDLKTVYTSNPSDLKENNPLILGIGTCLWTDWHVVESMIDQRVFPRIFALSEQMWNSGTRLPFPDFYQKVQKKYPFLKKLGIDYGPAMENETPADYEWGLHAN